MPTSDLTSLVSFPRTTILQCEGSIYIGIIVSFILYGIYVGLYCLSVYALCFKPGLARLHRILLVLFSSAVFLTYTIFFYSTPLLGQEMWIEHRNMFSAGPLMYYIIEDNTAGYMIAGNIAQNLVLILDNAFLVYRCFIVFGSRSLIIMPLALLVSGALALSVAAIPFEMRLFLPLANKLNATIIPLTMFTNIITTAVISYRILSLSYDLRKRIEGCPRWIIKPYTSAVAVLVESVAPSTILGAIISISIYLNTTVSWIDGAFLPWATLVPLSQQLITYRVSQRTAWTKNASGELTRAASTIAAALHEHGGTPEQQMAICQSLQDCHVLSYPDVMDEERSIGIVAPRHIKPESESIH